jgi:hypothetical protein
VDHTVVLLRGCSYGWGGGTEVLEVARQHGPLSHPWLSRDMRHFHTPCTLRIALTDSLMRDIDLFMSKRIRLKKDHNVAHSRRNATICPPTGKALDVNLQAASNKVLARVPSCRSRASADMFGMKVFP